MCDKYHGKRKKKAISRENDISTHIISFRLTANEYKRVQEEVKRTGAKTTSDFVRAAVLGMDIEVSNIYYEDPKKIGALQNLNKEIRKIGVNINQLAHIANTNKFVDDGTIKELSILVLDMSYRCKEIITETEKPFRLEKDDY